MHTSTCAGGHTHLQALPWQAATVEVHQDVTQRLKVVASALLNAKVRVNAGVARCACEVLVLPISDMFVRLGVAVPLGKTKIDDVDLVAAFAQAASLPGVAQWLNPDNEVTKAVEASSQQKPPAAQKAK